MIFEDSHVPKHILCMHQPRRQSCLLKGHLTKMKNLLQMKTNSQSYPVFPIRTLVKGSPDLRKESIDRGFERHQTPALSTKLSPLSSSTCIYNLLSPKGNIAWRKKEKEPRVNKFPRMIKKHIYCLCRALECTIQCHLIHLIVFNL